MSLTVWQSGRIAAPLDGRRDAPDSRRSQKGKRMDVRGILNATAFFDVVLDAEQLDALAAAVKVVHFGKRDVIVRERDLGDSMFALVEGKVSVSVHTPGGEKTVATLGPGEVVGEMSLVTGERRSATVTALGKVTALEITKAALEPILAAAPETGRALRDPGRAAPRRARQPQPGCPPLHERRRRPGRDRGADDGILFGLRAGIDLDPRENFGRHVVDQ